MLYDELCTLTESTYYSYERHGQIGSYVKDIVQEITVAVGGYRLVIRHVKDLLISITPKATSAGRGFVHIDPWDKHIFKPYSSGHRHADVNYSEDPCGPVKLKNALAIVTSAAIESECNAECLYKALGRSGSCAICGATLTDDLSMTRGIGPECYKKIYVNFSDVRKVQRRRISA